MSCFSVIVSYDTCRNSLQADILNFLESKSRVVFPSSQLEEFKASILEGIKQINNNSRCKDVHARWTQIAGSELGDQLYLGERGITSICNFRIYPIQEVMP